MRVTAKERESAIEQLRRQVTKGATVYTVLRHVSRSGMSRLISCYVIIDGEPRWLDGFIARAGLFTMDRKREALRVGGCGMDMGFHVVYELASLLYNGEGYALNQRWM